jgi:N6-adenosine-specific RNA methylase IME4
MENQLIKYHKAKFEINRLIIDESITQNEWQELGKGLMRLDISMQIWLGDWARFGIKRGFYVDSKVYDLLQKITGFERIRLQQYKYVAEKTESFRRTKDTNNLSYTHFEETAHLSKEKLEYFLTRANNEKLTTRELKEVIRKDSHADKKPLPLPEGIYNIIYADPPWQYDFAETNNRKIENHYPTMTVEELCEMPLPSIVEDALLLMWATAPKLCEAIKVINAWGFNYKTHSVWDKEIIGMGYWFRGQHELLMIATKGKFSPPDPEKRISSIYKEARTNHSRKPYFFYDWIDSAFEGNKIELFARNKRKGWEAWGNE